MTLTPNTYRLPERMKRAGVKPAPEKKMLLATLPLWLMLGTFVCLVLAFVCILLVGLGEGRYSYLRIPFFILLLLWLLGNVLTFVSALLGIVRGVSIPLNVFVLACLLGGGWFCWVLGMV